MTVQTTTRPRKQEHLRVHYREVVCSIHCMHRYHSLGTHSQYSGRFACMMTPLTDPSHHACLTRMAKNLILEPRTARCRDNFVSVQTIIVRNYSCTLYHVTGQCSSVLVLFLLVYKASLVWEPNARVTRPSCLLGIELATVMTGAAIEDSVLRLLCCYKNFPTKT